MRKGKEREVTRINRLRFTVGPSRELQLQTFVLKVYTKCLRNTPSTISKTENNERKGKDKEGTVKSASSAYSVGKFLNWARINPTPLLLSIYIS